MVTVLSCSLILKKTADNCDYFVVIGTSKNPDVVTEIAVADHLLKPWLLVLPC